MYSESVPNRGSPPAILLRESYRDGGKVKKRTLLNLSDWPQDRIAGFKMLLKGGTVIPKDQEAITIEAALAKRHLAGGTLVLYDVSSSYLEGLAARWRNSATTVTASRRFSGSTCPRDSGDDFCPPGRRRGALRRQRSRNGSNTRNPRSL
jgi:hypothetical protein